jgi:hypothetical protein
MAWWMSNGDRGDWPADPHTISGGHQFFERDGPGIMITDVRFGDNIHVVRIVTRSLFQVRGTTVNVTPGTAAIHSLKK